MLTLFIAEERVTSMTCPSILKNKDGLRDGGISKVPSLKRTFCRRNGKRVFFIFIYECAHGEHLTLWGSL